MLLVTFLTPGPSPGSASVRVLGTEKNFRLPQAPSADGGRYATKAIEFWDKGETATFTLDGIVEACRPKRG